MTPTDVMMTVAGLYEHSDKQQNKRFWANWGMVILVIAALSAPLVILVFIPFGNTMYATLDKMNVAVESIQSFEARESAALESLLERQTAIHDVETKQLATLKHNQDLHLSILKTSQAQEELLKQVLENTYGKIEGNSKGEQPEQ